MTLTQPPTPKIDAETAMRIGMNAKAMLLHLGRADDLASAAGLETDTDEPGSVGAFFEQMHDMCVAFDDWAKAVAREAGVDGDRYHATAYRFVDRRCGVLPDHVRDEDR